MKIIEVAYSQTRTTVSLPVLICGKICSVIGYQKGQGNCNSRSPCFFCICTDETSIKAVILKRGEGSPVGALKKSELTNLILFRQRDKALAVARAWTKKGTK